MELLRQRIGDEMNKKDKVLMFKDEIGWIQNKNITRYKCTKGNMNAQERESVRVTLSVIDNAKRKAARKAQKMAAAPTD